jgi:hypothetical protein
MPPENLTVTLYFGFGESANNTTEILMAFSKSKQLGLWMDTAQNHVTARRGGPAYRRGLLRGQERCSQTLLATTVNDLFFIPVWCIILRASF